MIQKIKQLPKRGQVREEDTWDLSSLFESDEAWDAAYAKWEKRIAGFAKFQGTLETSAKALADCLKFYLDFDRAGERLGTYAFLKTTEDTSNSTYQRMQGRFQNAASRAAQASSFLQPEIMAIADAKMQKLLAAKELA